MEDKGSRKVDYFTARYSLFKENQMHINDILNPQTKEEIFKAFINKLIEEIRIEVPIGNDKFIIYYNGTISDTRYLFKFAKKTERTLNQPTVSDIELTRVEDYPWCLLIIDLEKQIFLISRNSQITSNISTLKNSIAKVISSQLKKFQVSLQLELITNKNSFWDSVFQNTGEIRFVELTLISPNFLGQSYSTTKMLKEFRDELNNDSIVLKFTNNRGKLNISPKSHFLKDILEYIANGCGSWKIKVNTQRKAIESEDQAITYPLDMDMFTLTETQKEDIRIAFAHLDALESYNHEKDENNEESNN